MEVGLWMMIFKKNPVISMSYLCDGYVINQAHQGI